MLHIIGGRIGIQDLVKSKLGYGCKHLHCTAAADVYVELLWILGQGGGRERLAVDQRILSESIMSPQLMLGV